MGKHDVFSNSRNIIHKGSGDKAIASAPDVCKTQVGNSVVPIPYPNISQSSDLSKGSKSVKVNGQPAALKDSNFSSSKGDQAGSLKGVASGAVGDKTEFTSYSFDVKFEGKNVVRHADMTTHNKKNTIGMTMGSMTAPVIIKENEKKYKCDWKTCDEKHDHEISYSNDGCVVRAEYTGQWIEPWQTKSGKSSSKIIIKHYTNEVNKKRLDDAKKMFGTNRYPTDKHHLIPIDSIAELKQLSHNAKLVGFDVNNGKYGICLPYFVTDVFKHDLQCHRTSHPNYSAKVEDELKTLQRRCLKYCANGKQRTLLLELKELADDLRGYVKGWNRAWLLRKSAVADRKKSYKQAGLPHP